MRRQSFLLIAVIVMATASLAGAPGDRMVGINVVLKSAPTGAMLTTLGTYGKVRDVIPEINGLTMQIAQSRAAAVGALSFVEAWGFDQERTAGPITAQADTSMVGGWSTWDLSALEVTSALATPHRLVTEDGTGVYVAVLDTGLVKNWPVYFPTDRIAVEFAKCFGGGGGDNGTVSTQPNKWGEDQNSHGTHVTSTIIGYSLSGIPINGVAPEATIIPVKVLNQNGSGWSSVIARGITYVVDLKLDGKLGTNSVVINMSLGGPALDVLEKEAIDYAVANGVIIVASAGNNGTRGMGYPGAYTPVISVAAAGWKGEWTSPQWFLEDVESPEAPDNYYITDFSSRALAGQDLDVAAPGSWIVGPYQTNGQISYYFLGGTSMASPHVAGLVALMVQKNHSLTASQAEALLEGNAVTSPLWPPDAWGAGFVNAQKVLGAM